MSDVTLTITANDQDLIRALNRIKREIQGTTDNATNRFQSVFDKAKQSVSQFTPALIAANVAAGVVTTGINILRNSVLGSIRAAREFETALVGVGKTTGIAGADLQVLGNRIERLGRTVPTATKTLLEIAQAGGQLGITGSRNIEKFTEVIAKLGFTTDLSGEEAAVTLTRILNITGEGVQNIDRFGAALVALGNNFAATEAEIARNTAEVARATVQFGIGSANAAALGTALKALGVEARLGGTVVGSTFRQIDDALTNGGKKLEIFTKLTGLTADELRTTFQTNATEAFRLFAVGVDQAAKSGQSIATTLESVGLTGDGVLKVLPALVSRVDELDRAIKTANQGFAENNALNEEAAVQFQTLDARLQIARNQTEALQRAIGDKLTPVILFATNAYNLFLTALNGGEKARDSVEAVQREITTTRAQIAALEKDTSNAGFLGNYLRESKLEGLQERLAVLNAELRAFQETATQTAPPPIEGEEAGATGQAPTADPAVEIAKIQEANLRKLEEEVRYQTELQRIKDEASLVDLERELRFNQNLSETVIQERLAAEKLALDEQAKLQEAAALRRIGKENEANLIIERNSVDSKRRQLEEEKRLDGEKLEAAKSIAANLSTLVFTNSKELFAIGKAASIAQATINTYEGATKALSQGGVFGPALAAAVVINGLAQVSRIAAQQPRFQDGGIVPGSSFNGDVVSARVNSGEMILNRRQQAMLFDMANGGGSGPSVIETTIQLDGETIAKAVSRQVADGLELGRAV